MYDMADIMGCNVDKCRHVPSEGMGAFMKRAVDKADGVYRKVCSYTRLLWRTRLCATIAYA